MSKNHLVVIGDSREMDELVNCSVQLIVTSPPYFNVKDYGDFAENIGSINKYSKYLSEMEDVFRECYRVLDDGRYLCVNICDIISDKRKFPIPSHYVSILEKIGFDYRDDIIWKKPIGVGANAGGGAAKRFGVIIQHPYPMYYYPNNIYEHILVFRKGKFDFKQLTREDKEKARLDMQKIKKMCNSDIWELNPETKNQYMKDSHPAMFPEEIPELLTTLYSFEGDLILDPFLGSGTTTKVAKILGRRSVGYELNPKYLPLIKRKTGFNEDPDDFLILFRDPSGKTAYMSEPTQQGMLCQWQENSSSSRPCEWFSEKEEKGGEL